jgi:zinc transport system permease protein
MRIVGVLLVSSLMTLPVAASIRVAKSFKQAIILSIIFGEISVIGGLVSGFYLEIAPGGTIVIIAATLLLGTVLYKKFRYQKS